ncbi:MAG: hypothetical protein RI932_444 [Pseudomonadota bacterium]|jgi:uncharacterized protein YaiL (DUF2058 family)
MSLRDQLLKAGLVSKKQAKQADTQAKLQAHQAKKNKTVAEELEAQRQEELRHIENERLAKQKADLELNIQREQKRIERENLLRCMQLMRSNAVNQRNAPELYYFLEAGRFVRRVNVSAWQREMLARGQMAIGRIYDHVDEFVILPYHVAQTVLELHPSMILTLHSPVADDSEISVTED